MNDISISPNTAKVNDSASAVEAPSGPEADRYYLPDMIRLALDRLEGAATATARAGSGAKMAKAAADEVADQAAACELDAIVDAISDASDSLADVQGDLESIYQERAIEDDGPVVDAGDVGGNDEDGEGDDDDVAGYLAIGLSTSDRIIEGFIAAVGANRVLDALDRLTAPTKANTTS